MTIVHLPFLNTTVASWKMKQKKIQCLFWRMRKEFQTHQLYMTASRNYKNSSLILHR